MSWLILIFAGLLEVAWATGLKLHDGKPCLIFGTIIASVASVLLLAAAMRQIPLGTAYAAWTGIGIVGTMLAGALLLGESLTAGKLIFASLILAGIVGLKLSQ